MKLPSADRVEDLGQGMLSAIVCPLIPRELPAALKNLELWDETLCPVTDGESDSKLPKLIYSFSCSPDEHLRQVLIEEFDRRPSVKKSFSGIEVRFCDLPADKDIYVRYGENKPAPFGNKSGPNWLFYETLKSLRNDAEFVFLMETDCRPLAPNWVRRIQRVCVRNQDAWIVGSHYCGASPLPWSIARHINGNALYHIGDRQFWAFLEDRFWPWLNEYIIDKDPDLAYDCGWEIFLNRPELEHGNSYEWIRIRDILQSFRLSNFIVNIGGWAEQAGEYVWTRAEILNRFPGAVIVHGPLAESVGHRRGTLALGRPTMEGPATLDDAGIRVEADPEAVSFKRSLWLPGEPLDESHEIRISYSLRCPADSGITMEFRQPNGRLIGRKKKFGSDDKETSKGKYIQQIQEPIPYVRVALSFHGPEGTGIALSDVRWGVLQNGELVAQTNKIFE